MSSSDGSTTAFPLTTDVPNQTLSVAQISSPEIESLVISRASNRAYNNNILPVEILVYIFTFASAAYPSIFDTKNQALWNGRLTLAVIVSVCRFWRSAALGAQSLWSTIVLPLGSKHIQKCLEGSLRYSNKSVIDIFYFCVPGRPAYDDEMHKVREHDKILDILSKNGVSSRLRTLSNIPVGSFLEWKARNTRRMIGDLLQDTNQTLQAVGVCQWEHSTRTDPCHPPGVSTIVDILGCLPPNIRRLSITRPVSDSEDGIMEILADPTLQNLWGRLSHLKITGPHSVDLSEVAEIFRKCVSLEEVQLHWACRAVEEGDMYGPLFGNERLLLPHLRQLIVQSFRGDMTYLLDALSCPSIVHLAIKQDTTIFQKDEDHAASMRLESFIQRSFSISLSPKGVLHEIWVQGLSTRSIEYILSSHAARGVRSIALAPEDYMLEYPEWWESDPPMVPPLDLHNIYAEAAEDYGLSVSDMLERYETVPWYGWNHSVVPLRLSAFAIQCLYEVIIRDDTSKKIHTPTTVDSDSD